MIFVPISLYLDAVVVALIVAFFIWDVPRFLREVCGD